MSAGLERRKLILYMLCSKLRHKR